MLYYPHDFAKTSNLFNVVIIKLNYQRYVLPMSKFYSSELKTT